MTFAGKSLITTFIVPLEGLSKDQKEWDEFPNNRLYQTYDQTCHGIQEEEELEHNHTG